MYKSASYFLTSNNFYNPVEYSTYKGPTTYYQQPIIENFDYITPVSTLDTSQSDSNNTSQSDSNNTLEMTLENVNDVNTSNPDIWGPSLWFTLHNTASKYPVNPSPLYISKMKEFITCIPFIIPCEKCKVHAKNHIDDNNTNLDDICSSREKLFKFFVDFHNIVNKRYNKKEISYDEAFKIYNQKVNITKINYK